MACSLGGLSQRSGVTKGSLSRVEREETSASIASLVDICDALGLSMADLFPTPQTTLVRRDDRPRISDLPKAVDVVDTLVPSAGERHATVLETTAAPAGSGGWPTPARARACSGSWHRRCSTLRGALYERRGATQRIEGPGRRTPAFLPSRRQCRSAVYRDPHVREAAACAASARRRGRRGARGPIRHGHQLSVGRTVWPRGDPLGLGAVTSLPPGARHRRVRDAVTGRWRRHRDHPRQCAPYHRAARRGAAAAVARRNRSTRARRRPLDRARRTARAGRRPRSGRTGAARCARRHLGSVLRRALLPRHSFPARAGGGAGGSVTLTAGGHARAAVRRRGSPDPDRDGLRDDRRRGAGAAVAAAVRRPRAARIGDGPVYLSFDIDVLDPAFAPGTGTPEVAGLQPREAFAFLRALAGISFTGFDVVEVSPAYDSTGQVTALHAAAVAYDLLALMAVARVGRPGGQR